MGNVYKLNNSLVWVLVLGGRTTVNVGIFADYSVIYTVPELTSFAQSGPLTITGPQTAMVILPSRLLPNEVLATIDSRANLGAYREIIPTVPQGPLNLTITDLIADIGNALIKGNEYEGKITQITPPPDKP
jgi:hypothetical protein